jgi:hypothetical protein
MIDEWNEKQRGMRETFKCLCELYSFASFCSWGGTYTKMIDAYRKIDAIADDHPVLNFLAKYLYPLFSIK